jgi:signal transduction histidine kinase
LPDEDHPGDSTSEAIIEKLAELQAREKENMVTRTVLIIVSILSLALASSLFLLNLRTRKLVRELAQGKADMLETNNVKDRLFSIIGHDLRGPMNNIPVLLGFYHDAPPEEQKFIIDAIEESAINSANTLDTLLNWANRR